MKKIIAIGIIAMLSCMTLIPIGTSTEAGVTKTKDIKENANECNLCGEDSDGYPPRCKTELIKYYWHDFLANLFEDLQEFYGKKDRNDLESFFGREKQKQSLHRSDALYWLKEHDCPIIPS